MSYVLIPGSFTDRQGLIVIWEQVDSREVNRRSAVEGRTRLVLHVSDGLEMALPAKSDLVYSRPQNRFHHCARREQSQLMVTMLKIICYRLLRLASILESDKHLTGNSTSLQFA
jgi:hypothetical protein